MWEDKGMYWAWRSKESPTPTPTTKRLVYVTIVYPHVSMKLCCGVYDDEKFTPLNQDEIQWHKNNGADIIYGKV